jgi:hypothetical protein
MGMRIGYARVSSRGQKLDVQMDRLAECERIFYEKASGDKGDVLEIYKIISVSSLAPALFEEYAPLCLLREKQRRGCRQVPVQRRPLLSPNA